MLGRAGLQTAISITRTHSQLHTLCLGICWAHARAALCPCWGVLCRAGPQIGISITRTHSNRKLNASAHKSMPWFIGSNCPSCSPDCPSSLPNSSRRSDGVVGPDGHLLGLLERDLGLALRPGEHLGLLLGLQQHLTAAAPCWWTGPAPGASAPCHSRSSTWRTGRPARASPGGRMGPRRGPYRGGRAPARPAPAAAARPPEGPGAAPDPCCAYGARRL
jgi:hypothetical protein